MSDTGCDRCNRKSWYLYLREAFGWICGKCCNETSEWSNEGAS